MRYQIQRAVMIEFHVAVTVGEPVLACRRQAWRVVTSGARIENVAIRSGRTSILGLVNAVAMACCGRSE